MTRREALAMARDIWSGQRDGRIEDYQFIGGDQLSAAQAAARLGVSKRTIQRYRRDLKETQHA